jgi:hypothetical protein
MKAKILMFAVVIASLFAFTNGAKAQTNPTQDIPVVGSIVGGGNFSGTLDIQRFVSRNGQLVAVGSLTGTLTDALGTVIGTVTNVAAQLPVTNAIGTCQILQLDLGAIHLDLLGLVVDLAPVHLNITAQSGSGNLLGNLLCAVTNLLNGSGPLGALSGLLNNILRILG